MSIQSIFDCFIVFLAFINRNYISGAREECATVIVELLDRMNSFASSLDLSPLCALCIYICIHFY